MQTDRVTVYFVLFFWLLPFVVKALCQLVYFVLQGCCKTGSNSVEPKKDDELQIRRGVDLLPGMKTVRVV